jgi:thymidylate synthase ThyX
VIEAKIIADSINPVGDRLCTFVCTYPRFIHSEVMTHRVFSRNAASSRAIPVQKMIERILDKPAKPVSWGKNQKGMQAEAEVSEEVAWGAERMWHNAMLDAVGHARRLLDLGIHKQIANRLLEPFAHMTTIISATDWGNFFNLRAHKDAQPEFQELAFQMLLAYRDGKPIKKQAGEWHLPFADKYLGEGLSTEQLLKITVARCARVTYLNFEGDINHAKDYQLHDDLLASGHMSPFEHAAKAITTSGRCGGNFAGWLQYRKHFRNENRQVLDIEQLLAERKAYGRAA